MSEKKIKVAYRTGTDECKVAHKRITLTAIMCYAPTNDAEKEETEEVYGVLRTTLCKRTEKETVVVMETSMPK